MKSVPGTASFALHTVASSMVLPIVTITAPSACLASLPVSMVMVRPSASVMVLVITFINNVLVNSYISKFVQRYEFFLR